MTFPESEAASLDAQAKVLRANYC